MLQRLFKRKPKDDSVSLSREAFEEVRDALMEAHDVAFQLHRTAKTKTKTLRHGQRIRFKSALETLNQADSGSK